MLKWTYFLGTVDGLPSPMQSFEDTITQQFLPALTGRDSPSDFEHELLTLPAHHGGLGLVNPTTLKEEHTYLLIVPDGTSDCTYSAVE